MASVRRGNGSGPGGATSGPTPFMPEPSPGFISPPYIKDLTERALSYLEIGYPVHFAGVAGTGKSTMALDGDSAEEMLDYLLGRGA